MKKTLVIISFIGMAGAAHAINPESPIGKELYKQMFNGCVPGAIQSGTPQGIAVAYCKCMSTAVVARAAIEDVDDLEKLLEFGDQEAPKCVKKLSQ